ncbi:DUF2793 domain-containing protein [Sphingomonas sp. AP4-R1]|uniref:DUF2793 domain-containing protein n=1 Tax=Sphingomonas sp. AP4-R1 TaxID=2735134 RepID=UPI001493AFF4|nr:DUF2793 domain-containing protein [Sphingomonas sp. AP4-R1]QJU57537.1 DUF2793 domain-containing protein [Sphingomonas sp. AP4-R1]
MSETTPRLSLPLLQAGQAQKEALHNEALIVIDGILAGMVESVGEDHPPAMPAPGQAWIVGPAPTGDWAGQADAVAIWTAGGWRFAPAKEGMAFRLKGSGVRIERGSAIWGDGAAVATVLKIGGVQVVGPRLSGISAPAGGSVVDTEARAALGVILVALRSHGLISS